MTGRKTIFTHYSRSWEMQEWTREGEAPQFVAVMKNGAHVYNVTEDCERMKIARAAIAKDPVKARQGLIF